MNKKLAMAKLVKAGIKLVNGKIPKGQVAAAYKVLANDELTYEGLRELANVGADGMGALDIYMEKYHDSAEGETVVEALGSFKTDCEEYIFPAIDSMLSSVGEAESKVAKASVDLGKTEASEDVSIIHSMDSYFKACEEGGQGINSKESRKMHEALVRHLKERMGNALDLKDELTSRNGQQALQRAMDEAYPGMRKMFAKASYT